MGVEAISGANNSAVASSASSDAAKKTGLDYDTFLKLLIAQMRNQDPTDPMDSTEQIAQLATFSQVEQTIQTNKNLETLIQSSLLSQAGSVVGKTVSSADGTISGVVEKVKILSDGAEAILTNGLSLPVGPGMVISGT